MKEATVIYPHQLFLHHPALQQNRVVYLVEEPLLMTEFGTHAQKLLLHRLSMQAYRKHLENKGFQVIYLPIQSLSDSTSVFTEIANAKYSHLHIVDTTDNWLEKRINTAECVHDFKITRYESPLFLLSKNEAVERYKESKKHMARFYKQLRKDKNILVTESGEPVGDQWSFDTDNRKKVPKNLSLPADISFYENADTESAELWLETVSGEIYGERSVWLPYTHEGARVWLEDFLTERFSNFGTYEDAIVTEHSRLFHSALSPLMNIGLITPKEITDAVLEYGKKHDIGINSIEGFVRQVIGWREFIRASYECDGSHMRTQNFWNHSRTLPESFWNASTKILPIDTSIKNALHFGYGHHIERLMVLGNFMLLTETHPDEVYRWFMSMYVDAYDWVMVPNVYGMSQFADGGSFATKPYISGSNYLKKMSDYATGSWEEVWTALYWNFICSHTDFFTSNHRLSMMPRLWEKMDTQKKDTHLKIASKYLQENKES